MYLMITFLDQAKDRAKSPKLKQNVKVSIKNLKKAEKHETCNKSN